MSGPPSGHHGGLSKLRQASAETEVFPVRARKVTHRTWSLRAHLIAFGLALLLPTVALGAVAAWQAALAYQGAAEARLRETARALSLALDSQIEAYLAAATTLASSPTLRSGSEADVAALLPWVMEISEALGGRRIVVNDARQNFRQILNAGIASETAPNPPVGSSAGPQDFLRQIAETGRPGISDLFRGRADAAPAVAVGVPVHVGERVERVVTVGIGARHISDLLVTQGMSGEAYVSVSDGQRQIVARSRDHDRFVGTIPPSLSGPSGEIQQGIFRAPTVYGFEGVYARETLRNAPGWTLVVVEPAAAQRAAWLRPLLGFAGGTALVLAMAGVAAAILARRVLWPVRELGQQADEVTSGDGGPPHNPADTAGPTSQRDTRVTEFLTLQQGIARANAALHARATEFRQAFEQAPVAMSQSDPATARLVRVNDVFCRLLGRPATELVGRSIAEITHPEDRAADLAGFQRMARGEIALHHVEKRFLRPDGSVRWVRVSASLLRDAAGTALRTLALLEDITDRKEAEEALRSGEALKAAVFEAALDCIVTIDPASRVVEWNPAAERVFGYTREKAFGRDLAELLIPPERREAHRRGIAHYLETNESPVLGRRVEVTVLRADGVPLPVELAITPAAVGGKPLFVAYMRDITERRRAEAALRESEAHFRAVADNIPQMAWLARNDGGRYWSNRRWHDYTGLSPEASAGLGWRQVHHPQHLPRVLERMREAWEAGVPWEDTFPLRRKDGEYRWFLTRAVPVHDEDGQVTLWFGTNTDVTERRASQAALAESEARLRAAVEGSPFPLMLHADDGEVLALSHSWTELSGYGREEIPTYSDWVRLAFSRLTTEAEVSAPVESAPGEPVRTGEQVVRVKSGAKRVWDFHTVPLGRLPDARLLRMNAAIDVTERKRADEALARHRAELERLVESRTAALLREAEERRKAEEALRQGEKLQALGRLTGGIAHDFNNILQIVASGAELLRRPDLAERRRDAVLDGVEKATGSAKELTRRLLAFARRQPLKPEPFDLNARLLGLTDLLRGTLGPDIHLAFDLSPDLWPVHADPNQMEVAVLNLAANARDAMTSGGTLTLRTRNAPASHGNDDGHGWVCVMVTDTGVGISPAVLSQIFEPFFTTKGPDKGTGLGLAQVHGFAMQSGGDVSAGSVPGQGTTITLQLPRAMSVANAPAKHVEYVKRRQRPHHEAAGKTVLVVDDNPDVATFACSMLEDLGYTTRRVADAERALALLETGDAVHAVFSDVVMPGSMNGVDLAGILRARHPGLAVVLATGYSDVLVERGGDIPAEVLNKPYALDDVAGALGRAFAAVGVATSSDSPVDTIEKQDLSR